MNRKKLENEVMVTLVSLKCSDAAELSHGQMAFGVFPPLTQHTDAALIRPSWQKWFPFPLPGAVTFIKLITLFIQHN